MPRPAHEYNPRCPASRSELELHVIERVHVIGSGRVGSAITARLRERGVAVREGDPDVVLLCVPDTAIGDVPGWDMSRARRRSPRSIRTSTGSRSTRCSRSTGAAIRLSSRCPAHRGRAEHSRSDPRQVRGRWPRRAVDALTRCESSKRGVGVEVEVTPEAAEYIGQRVRRVCLWQEAVGAAWATGHMGFIDPGGITVTTEWVAGTSSLAGAAASSSTTTTPTGRTARSTSNRRNHPRRDSAPCARQPLPSNAATGLRPHPRIQPRRMKPNLRTLQPCLWVASGNEIGPADGRADLAASES